MATQPSSRDDFEIAIICALSREYNAVSRIFDGFWDETQYGRAIGDQNTYATGRIGNFNAVLVLLAGIGKVEAASATASLRASFPNLELVLLTGICGGIPSAKDGEELLLGDVIISNSVVQYDRGRQYADKFETTDTLSGRLGRPTKNIRNFVKKFETTRALEQLEKQAATHLEGLQNPTVGRRRAASYQYPGADNDLLFRAGYRHKHHSPEHCAECSNDSVDVCENSRRLSCRDLGCDNGKLVRRDRLEKNKMLERTGRSKEAQAPFVFIGTIGSGDWVLKSDDDRDRIAKEHGLIAFEMEGAGVWDEIPCIIVKGVCDYADSHKNKEWQDFASATAASVAKALIEKYPQTDKRVMPENGVAKDRGGSRDQERAGSINGPVFHGNASGNKIVTGFSSSGGTQTLNF